MTLPPKLIAVLCLVQCFFVSAGTLVTRAGLKACAEAMATPPPIPPLVGFVGAHGLWFLLVPLLWCVVAVFRGRVGEGGASVSPLQAITGIVLTIALVLTFAISALRAIDLLFQPRRGPLVTQPA